MADEKEKIPDGHVKVTIQRLEIVNGQAYGPGTYHVSEAVKRELDRRGGGSAGIAGGTAPQDASGPTPKPPTEVNPAASSAGGPAGLDEDPMVTYRKELSGAGITRIDQLKGMDSVTIQQKVPGITPVGAAKLSEAANG